MSKKNLCVAFFFLCSVLCVTADKASAQEVSLYANLVAGPPGSAVGGTASAYAYDGWIYFQFKLEVNGIKVYRHSQWRHQSALVQFSAAWQPNSEYVLSAEAYAEWDGWWDLKSDIQTVTTGPGKPVIDSITPNSGQAGQCYSLSI